MTVRFDATGKYLAAGGFDHVRVWEIASHHLYRDYQQLKGVVSSLDISSTGLVAAGISSKPTAEVVRLWRLSSASWTRKAQPARGLRGPSVAASICFTGTGSHLVVSDNTPRIFFLDSRTGRTVWIESHGKVPVSNVACSNTDSKFAVASAAGIEVYEMKRRPKLVTKLGAPHGGVSVIRFDGRLGTVFVGGYQGSLLSWKLAPRPKRRILRPASRPSEADVAAERIASIDVHPSRNVLAAASKKLGVSLFEADTGRRIGHLPNFGNRIPRSVRFNPDGTTIAVAYTDNSIRLWRPVRK